MHDDLSNNSAGAQALRILYEDAYLVAAVKPAGVLSEAGGMPELLAERCGGARPLCVHRLDRDVGGVMVYAKDGAAAAKLSASIASRAAVKEYLAVVQGVPDPPAGTLRDLLFHDAAKNKTYVVDRPRRGVREAELEYRLLATARDAAAGALSLLAVTLHTGRSHQIRVQFASRKMPVAGDRRYGSALRGCGIALFSRSLTLAHPVTGETLHFRAAPPSAWPWTEFSAETREA